MGLKDILYRQQRQVEALFEEYMGQWQKCTEGFAKAMEMYLDEGLTDNFAYWVEHTHKMESLADDKRREIEYQLYAKAMLPESRGDILGLLETIDKVINKVESVLFQIYLERIEVPQEIIPSISRIFTITVECLELVYISASRCFKKPGDILELAEEIDQKESECDHAERETIKKVFDSDLDWHLKFQLKNLIIEMGNITDRAESVSDRMVITSVKRRV